MKICKTFSFDAAHWLPYYSGKCSQLHGHRWMLEVEVSGSRLVSEGAKCGMLLDFVDLKGIVNQEVINKLDHTCLNDIFENPTCELVVLWIQEVIKRAFHDSKLQMQVSRLRLYESPDSYAELS